MELQNAFMCFSVTCRVRSTDLKSASATKQKRAKKVTSVRTSVYFKTNLIPESLCSHLISCNISPFTPFLFVFLKISIALSLSVHALPAEPFAKGPDD